SLTRLHKFQFIMIAEPMTYVDKLENIARKLNFKNFASNVNSKIWIFWKEYINCTILINHEQFLHLYCSGPNGTVSFHVSVVYAKCNRFLRQQLWDGLRELHEDINDPWLVVGDFNTVLSPHERSGGNSFPTQSILDFQSMLHDCNLSDAGYIGSEFTW